MGYNVSMENAPLREPTEEEASEFCHRIDSEGMDYAILYYGVDTPGTTLQPLIDAAKVALQALEEEKERLMEKYGIEEP